MVFNPKESERRLAIIRIQQQEKKAREMAILHNLPYIDLTVTPIDLDALALVPKEKAEKGLFVPFQKIEKRILFATVDPQNPLLKETTEKFKNKGFIVEILICSKRSLERALKEYSKVPASSKEVVGKIKIKNERIGLIEKEIKNIADLKSRLENISKEGNGWVLEMILGSALALRVSDIHIVSALEGANLRYRIDGILYDITLLNEPMYHSLLNRLKLLSGLKVNIEDIAQDGRFSIFAKEQEIEVRLSVIPGEYGEDIVMRILNPDMILSIEELGLHPWHQEDILREIRKPTGMILICGPTGSGKTTTLYACLKKVATSKVKVITIEDPIEYHLENVDQTQIEPEKGYGFTNALRAAMRQDPDIILIGEIRDGETAETAIQAALTGHLVFSTLHTNDAAGAIPRLIELGANPTSIAPAFNLIVSQRLLRKVCKKCAKKIIIDEKTKEKIKKELEGLPLEIKPNLEGNIEIFQPQGCVDCNNSGYKGRIGVFEILKKTPIVEKTILTIPSISIMREIAIQEGMITIRQDGILRVLEGITTIEELERVLGPIEE